MIHEQHYLEAAYPERASVMWHKTEQQYFQVYNNQDYFCHRNILERSNDYSITGNAIFPLNKQMYHKRNKLNLPLDTDVEVKKKSRQLLIPLKKKKKNRLYYFPEQKLVLYTQENGVKWFPRQCKPNRCNLIILFWLITQMRIHVSLLFTIYIKRKLRLEK